MKSDCWAKGGGKEGQGPKGKKGKKGESNKVEGKDADKIWMLERKRGEGEDSEWENMVEINLRGWWTPEERIEKDLEGLSTLYTHDPIIWDVPPQEKEKETFQDSPTEPEVNSGTSTPTNTRSNSTGISSPATDDLSVILNNSDSTSDNPNVSLAEGSADFDSRTSYDSQDNLPALQDVSDSGSEDCWSDDGVSDSEDKGVLD
jgi:hypothetical protein